MMSAAGGAAACAAFPESCGYAGAVVIAVLALWFLYVQFLRLLDKLRD